MAVSIEDVARRAGVSRGTVSHVINGNVAARIAASTQERVWKAVSDLGYHPNRIARSLGRRRTDIVGLIIPSLTNPFFVQIMESMEQLALKEGYQVLLDAMQPISSSGKPVAKLQGWPVDGVLMWSTDALHSLVQMLGAQAGEVPVVYLGGHPRQDNTDSVYFDVYRGAVDMMNHLVEKGFRKIGFLYPFDWVLEQEDEPRQNAYTKVCQESGIEPLMIRMEIQEETRRAGLVAGIELAKMDRNEATEVVLCFNDIVAEGVLFGLRRGGLKVPDDMGVVGIDGIQTAQYLDTPLTTVRLPTEQMCSEALRILLRRIAEGTSAPAIELAIAPELVKGATA